MKNAEVAAAAVIWTILRKSSSKFPESLTALPKKYVVGAVDPTCRRTLEKSRTEGAL
uniref:Uncharacterized protein n=1 Tax=Arion vulgaris TaxID=1028688 RepID=A0A0B7AN16_9EUPU